MAVRGETKAENYTCRMENNRERADNEEERAKRDRQEDRRKETDKENRIMISPDCTLLREKERCNRDFFSVFI